jgi:hypothetical protein
MDAQSNWWEAGLNKEVWVNGRRCSTCSGIMKYKYNRMGRTDIELWIFPMRRTFQVITNGRLGLNGSIDDMKTLLDAQ